MERLKALWKKSSTFERITSIITGVFSCCAIILSSIGLAGIISINIINSIVIPMLGVITLINGLAVYKKNRITGILNFICAGFILFCTISVFAMKFLK